MKWMPDFIVNKLKKEVDYAENCIFGNAFDLGDIRTPIFMFWSSTLWNIRNTAYNFNYMFEECRVDSKNHFYTRWTTKYFDWHFGFLPKGAKDAGRMVWFSEDIHKVK
jgi:hypothetical protein